MPMTSSKPSRKNIEGIPAERYKARYKEERSKMRRHFCTVFKFWRTCRFKPCQRERACMGDAYACLKRNEPTVPRMTQWRARQDMIEALPAKEGPERAAREHMPSELYR